MKDIKLTWNASADGDKWQVSSRTKGKTSQGEDIGDRPIKDNYENAVILSSALDLYEMTANLIAELEDNTRKEYGNIVATTVSKKVCNWTTLEYVKVILDNIKNAKENTK